MKERTGVFMLLLASLIWGSSYVAIHFALADGVPTFYLIGLRLFIACIALFTLFHKKIIANFKVQLVPGIFVGSSMFLGFYFQTHGLLYTTPSKSGFISSIAVILAPIFSYFVEKTNLDKYTLGGAFLTLIGIGFITLSSGISSINYGDIVSLGAAIFFGLYMTLLGYYSNKNFDLVTSVFMQFLIAMIWSFIGSFYLESYSLSNLTMSGILSIGYLAIFCTLIGFYLQTSAFKSVPSGKGAVILSTESVFATISSVLLVHEKLSTNMVIGSIIVFIAILTVELKPSFSTFKSKKKRFV